MAESPRLSETEVAVIGGGLLGSALAWGLARAGRRVTVLDEGDLALRASRANFALVWIQGKGADLPAYASWTLAAAAAWPRLAAVLKDESGLDVALDQPGGFTLCLSERELEANIATMARLRDQPGMEAYPYEVLDHARTEARLPALGREVVGAIYSPLDGHVNSLRLFRAFHTAMARRGVDYRAGHPVETIVARDGGFALRGAWGEVRAGRLVLAAGLGNERLAPMVGLAAPTRVSKGQIIVTEKAAPFLRHPVVTIRQTDEGGVMIGDSDEARSRSLATDPAVSAVMADRAIRMFPLLADLNVVRTWSAFRVISPDGFPVYEQSREHPGAFVALAHSGVTLAPNHAFTLADHIAAGALPDGLAAFSPRRFHVPAAA